MESLELQVGAASPYGGATRCPALEAGYGVGVFGGSLTGYSTGDRTGTPLHVTLLTVQTVSRHLNPRD
jgi:hypothetical protein